MNVQGRPGAQPWVSVDLEVELSALTEQVRQLVILTSKLISAHAGGQTLTYSQIKGRNKKEKESENSPTPGDSKESKFVGDRLREAIQRLNSDSNSVNKG